VKTNYQKEGLAAFSLVCYEHCDFWIGIFYLL